MSGAPSLFLVLARAPREQWRRARRCGSRDGTRVPDRSLLAWLVNLAGDGSHRKTAAAVGVGHDRGCAAPARACVRGGGQRGGKAGRVWTTEDGPGGAHVAVGWTRTRLDAPFPARGRAHASFVLLRVARSFAVALQRLQGRMRGFSAAGSSQSHLASSNGSPVWSDGPALCFFHSSELFGNLE